MKIVLSLILSLALAWETKAQFLTGSLTASSDFNGASATSSSITLVTSNTIDFDSGGFAASVPTNSLLMVRGDLTISGLSTTPLSDSINDFFVFSYPAPGVGIGTTPFNRFDFDLSSITETSYTGGANNTATFSGTGTIVDTTGAFQDTSAEFTVDFEHPSQYLITLEAVPEPATISLVTTGLLAAFALRRRKG
jgi:hypothetical protein